MIPENREFINLYELNRELDIRVDFLHTASDILHFIVSNNLSLYFEYGKIKKPVDVLPREVNKFWDKRCGETELLEYRPRLLKQLKIFSYHPVYPLGIVTTTPVVDFSKYKLIASKYKVWVRLPDCCDIFIANRPFSLSGSDYIVEREKGIVLDIKNKQVSPMPDKKAFHLIEIDCEDILVKTVELLKVFELKKERTKEEKEFYNSLTSLQQCRVKTVVKAMKDLGIVEYDSRARMKPEIKKQCKIIDSEFPEKSFNNCFVNTRKSGFIVEKS